MRKFIPYGKQWLDKADIRAVTKVLRSDFLAQGPQVEKFEQTICHRTGARFCVAVSNGTAALHLAVAALDIKKGSEGITTPITFVASANCLLYNNLIPVFTDIDAKTFNIDPTEIEKKITKKTKVIVAVDFAGQPTEAEKIHKIAKSKGLYVIEDAAHAIGSKYKNGLKVGSNKYSDLTVFSFHPVKTITTGEGGAVTTNDEKLYKRLILLRSHGITKDAVELKNIPGPWYYEMRELGFNYRLTDIQAALGISQFKKLDWFVKRRRAIVNYYNKVLSTLPNLTIPYEQPGVYSAFHLYVVEIDFDKISLDRREFMEKLRNIGIGTQVHYIPLYSQPYYKKHFSYKKSDFPNVERYYKMALSLPLYPKMRDEEVGFVTNSIKDLLNEK